MYRIATWVDLTQTEVKEVEVEVMRPNNNSQTKKADKSNKEMKTLQDYEFQLNKCGEYEKTRNIS